MSVISASGYAIRLSCDAPVVERGRATQRRRPGEPLSQGDFQIYPLAEGHFMTGAERCCGKLLPKRSALWVQLGDAA